MDGVDAVSTADDKQSLLENEEVRDPRKGQGGATGLSTGRVKEGAGHLILFAFFRLGA